MKVLIWFLCILANVTITTMLRAAGILLGGIPTGLLFAGTWWLAHTLCKSWDRHKENKEFKPLEENKTQQAKEATEQRPAQSNLPPHFSTDMMPKENQWKCTCGRIHQKYESSCVCGVSKAEAMNGAVPQKAPSQTTQEASTASRENIVPARFCRMCGNELTPNSRFCGKCGYEIKNHQ